MKSLVLVAFLAVFVSSVEHGTLRGDRYARVLKKNPQGVPEIVVGNLGNVGVAVSKRNENALQNAAATVLTGILEEHFGGSGIETLSPKSTYISGDGSAHVRVVEEINGHVVEGASFVVHIDASGTITSVNGEYVNGQDAPNSAKLGPNDALEAALEKGRLSGEWLGGPILTVVRSVTGSACLAWMRLLSYEGTDKHGNVEVHTDAIYADSQTGYLCARHPKNVGFGMDDETEQPTDLVEAPKTTARRLQEEPPVASLETYDCQQGTICNVLSSNSPKAIATGDLAVDSAHNFALATWEYYNTTHGRDSIDGNGMTLKSRVHYGQNYNNAFWNGVQMTYGDGDGVYFAPLSQDADVVGHELTHGITERTSGLIYAGESGALNEAWSDIFGAMVDVFTGATGADIWRIGEDIYTPKIPGDALRFMNDPALAGDYDWYPTRYMCGGDNGGVHWNSGIANLAFVLLSDGGKHPRDKSSVVVTGIGMERAAEVFYAANFCLTANSGFYMARYCTAAAAGSLLGGSYASAVHLAWDAVGVPAEPPVIPEPIEISDNVSLEGLAGPKGEIQQYYLLVGLGETVTCTTSGNNGDADLYLRFGAKAEAHPDSRVNECGSYTPESNEACTTGAASSVGTTLYAAIHAYDCYNNLILTCTVNAPSSGCTKGAFRDSCTVNADCCSNNCGGNPRNRKCKN